MTRPLRLEFPGAFYHIVNRGNAQGKIFLNNRDREKFLEYLKDSVDRFSLRVHAYCLMDNHYHLIVETPEGNISQALQWLNVSYAVYFNKKRKRIGHLFQGRFKSLIINAEEYLQVLSRYIHLNPVRTQSVKQPEDYPWSSYTAFIGIVEIPEWLETTYVLSTFHKARSKAMHLYKKFCEDVDPTSLRNPSKDAVQGFILGNDNFVQLIQRQLVDSNGDENEIPQLRKLKLRPAVEEVIEEVGKEFVCQKEDIIRTGKKGNTARETAIYLSCFHTGLTGKEIGSYYGQISGARVAMILKKIKTELATNRQFGKKVKKIEERIVNN
jgi:REP element-mobilizing transposase RayT